MRYFVNVIRLWVIFWCLQIFPQDIAIFYNIYTNTDYFLITFVHQALSPAQGVVSVQGGFLSISVYMTDTPSSPCPLTDTCKNIPLAYNSFRTVTSLLLAVIILFAQMQFSLNHYRIQSPNRTIQSPDQKNREWSDEEMINCIAQILDGHTYQDMTRDKLVPILTLWTRCNSIFLTVL